MNGREHEAGSARATAAPTAASARTSGRRFQTLWRFAPIVLVLPALIAGLFVALWIFGAIVRLLSL